MVCTVIERDPLQLNPKAWMGYAALTPKVTVRICSYCPDKAQADSEAIAAGQAITHSICPSCYQEQLEKLKLI